MPRPRPRRPVACRAPGAVERQPDRRVQMTISVFDLFKIGIEPSSSHTVGPMRAALTFVTGLRGSDLLTRTAAVRAELFGSLGATGHGHGSAAAVLLGLEGEAPDRVDPHAVAGRLAAIR